MNNIISNTIDINNNISTINNNNSKLININNNLSRLHQQQLQQNQSPSTNLDIFDETTTSTMPWAFIEDFPGHDYNKYALSIQNYEQQEIYNFKWILDHNFTSKRWGKVNHSFGKVYIQTENDQEKKVFSSSSKSHVKKCCI